MDVLLFGLSGICRELNYVLFKLVCFKLCEICDIFRNCFVFFNKFVFIGFFYVMYCMWLYVENVVKFV